MPVSILVQVAGGLSANTNTDGSSDTEMGMTTGIATTERRTEVVLDTMHESMGVHKTNDFDIRHGSGSSTERYIGQ